MDGRGLVEAESIRIGLAEVGESMMDHVRPRGVRQRRGLMVAGWQEGDGEQRGEELAGRRQRGKRDGVEESKDHATKQRVKVQD